MAAATADLRVFDDPEALADALATAFDAAAEQSVAERGGFSVALAGGRTPGGLYHLLATRFGDRAWWAETRVYWSDERYVPPDHPDSNVGAARTAVLDSVGLPPAHVLAPDTTLVDPEEAARQYGRALRDAGGLDLVLLGLGEDAHVASLFPGGTALDEGHHRVVVVSDSPKPPAVRLTMTLVAFREARATWILASGASKAGALAASLQPASRQPGTRTPAARVAASGARVTWWVDREAAGIRPRQNV